ncbi:MAG: carboxymuconolactone decarboxylase family protein [Burkholderiales bacterium]
MSPFVSVDPATAEGKSAELLARVKAGLGIVPNMARRMAQSPAVLDAYLAMAGALGGGTLRAPLRERIALAVAQANGCDYCLAAHGALGKGAGLRADDILAARQGEAGDARAQAALHFAQAVLDKRGHVDAADIAAIHDAGFDGGAIGEVVANVALNVFTNYFNSVAGTPVDFPAAPPLPAAKAA